MSHQLWYEHFKSELQDLTKSFEESGTSLSLLGYCLQQKMLTADAYLKWAMTHYCLPQIKPSFFSETPLSQEMFAKWATHYPWSTECLPVAEWDGALLVACLQPPQDFPQFPACAFILARPEDLEGAWKTLQGTSEVQKTSDAPEGLQALASIPSAAPDSFSLDDLGPVALEASTNPSIELPQAPDDSMEGLLDGPTVVSLQPLADMPPVKEDSFISENLAPTENKPLSLISEVNPEISEEATVVHSAHPAAPAASKEVPVIAPVAAKKVISDEQTRIPPPPESSTGFPPHFEESFGNRPIPVIPRPAGVAKASMNNVAAGHFSLERLKKKNSQAIAEKVKSTLSEMKTHFDKSMILTLDEDETQLTAFAWDESFQGIKDTGLRIPLKIPSVFNIVASTQKPFHGYISLNDVNEKFFEGWNAGVIPDHITITPILISEKVVGMLVGFADKSAYNKASLTLAEKLSNDFLRDLRAA